MWKKPQMMKYSASSLEAFKSHETGYKANGDGRTTLHKSTSGSITLE